MSEVLAWYLHPMNASNMVCLRRIVMRPLLVALGPRVIHVSREHDPELISHGGV